MSLLTSFHQGYIHPRRVRVLAARIAGLLPEGCSVLDVGAGDGWIARLLQDAKPAREIVAIDTQVRQGTHIPVIAFDGSTIPFRDGRFDVALLVDVLHHASNPRALLLEARRVATRHVIIKDHTCESRLDAMFLRWMDRVSNVPHGVPLRFNFKSRSEWEALIESVSARLGVWIQDIGLYPVPTNLLLERRMHFLARLDCG